MVSGQVRTRYEDATDAEGKRITRVTNYDSATGKIVNVSYRGTPLSTPYGTPTTPRSTPTYTRRPSMTEIERLSKDGRLLTQKETTQIAGRPYVSGRTAEGVEVSTPYETRVRTTTGEYFDEEVPRDLTMEERAKEAGIAGATGFGVGLFGRGIAGLSSTGSALVSGAGQIAAGSVIGSGVGDAIVNVADRFNLLPKQIYKVSDKLLRAGDVGSVDLLVNVPPELTKVINIVPDYGRSVIEGIKTRPELFAASAIGGGLGWKAGGKVVSGLKSSSLKLLNSVDKQSSNLVKSIATKRGQYGGKVIIGKQSRIESVLKRISDSTNRVVAKQRILAGSKSSIFQLQSIQRQIQKELTMPTKVRPSYTDFKINSRFGLTEKTGGEIIGIASRRGSSQLSSLTGSASALAITKAGKATTTKIMQQFKTNTKTFSSMQTKAINSFKPETSYKITPQESVRQKRSTRVTTISVVVPKQITTQILKTIAPTNATKLLPKPAQIRIPVSFYMPDLPSIFRKKKEKKKKGKKRIAGYAPSVKGIDLGKIKIPKIITGLEVRGSKPRRKKKTKKRR